MENGGQLLDLVFIYLGVLILYDYSGFYYLGILLFIIQQLNQDFSFLTELRLVISLGLFFQD